VAVDSTPPEASSGSVSGVSFALPLATPSLQFTGLVMRKIDFLAKKFAE